MTLPDIVSIWLPFWGYQLLSLLLFNFLDIDELILERVFNSSLLKMSFLPSPLKFCVCVVGGWGGSCQVLFDVVSFTNLLNLKLKTFFLAVATLVLFPLSTVISFLKK